MLENKAIILKDKVEIPKLQLWLIWLLLFVFPTLVTIIVFDYFGKEYKYFANTDLIYKGFEDIKKYNDLIVPEKFIEEQQTKIKALDTNLSPEDLKKQIDNIISGETLYCIFFDEEVKNAKIVKNPNTKNIPSILLIRNFKQFINNYYLFEKDISKKSAFDNSQSQLASFLQTFFNTVTPVTISLNKTSKNFSVVQNGEMYFIFTEFERPNKNCASCFAVLRGEDFSYIDMIKKLQNQFPEINIVFRKFPLNETVLHNKPVLNYCGIRHNKNEIYIIAPTDLKFTRHVIFNGTYTLDERLNNLFPFIKYNISLEEVEKEFKAISRLINYIAIIIIFISAIYFLYISLFNFNKNLKFKTKILILTLFSSLFPFSVCSFSVYSYEYLNRFIVEASVKHQAEFELNFAAKELEHYIMEIESKLSDFAQTLSKDLTDPDIKASFLLKRLDNIVNTIPISKESLYLNQVPKNLEVIFTNKQIEKKLSDRLSDELFEEMYNKEIDYLPSTILP